MTYEEAISAIRPFVGGRVRVTWSDTARRVGVVGLWRPGTEFECPTLGGHLCGGEYDGCVRVEVLERGRYRRVTEDAQALVEARATYPQAWAKQADLTTA